MSEETTDLLVLWHEKRIFLEKALVKGAVEDHVRELREQTGKEVKIVQEALAAGSKRAGSAPHGTDPVVF